MSEQTSLEPTFDLVQEADKKDKAVVKTVHKEPIPSISKHNISSTVSTLDSLATRLLSPSPRAPLVTMILNHRNFVSFLELYYQEVVSLLFSFEPVPDDCIDLDEFVYVMTYIIKSRIEYVAKKTIQYVSRLTSIPYRSEMTLPSSLGMLVNSIGTTTALSGARIIVPVPPAAPYLSRAAQESYDKEPVKSKRRAAIDEEHGAHPGEQHNEVPENTLYRFYAFNTLTARKGITDLVPLTREVTGNSFWLIECYDMSARQTTQGYTENAMARYSDISFSAESQLLALLIQYPSDGIIPNISRPIYGSNIIRGLSSLRRRFVTES